MSIDIKQKILSCHICNWTFKFTSALKNHMINKHIDIDESNKLYMRTKKSDNSVGCDGSNQIITKVEHSDEGNNVFNCTKCKLSFKFSSVYQMHLSIVHNSKIQENIKCIICFANFDTRKSLRFHNSQDHGLFDDGQSLSTCFICGASVKQLREHVRNVHEQVEKVKCTYCEKEYKNKYELSKHFKRNHESIAPCASCGKIFKCLSRHLKTTNCGGDPGHVKKKVQCNICGKLISTKEKLKVHTKQIHNQVRDKQCDRCEYNTYNVGNLRLHINTQHLGMKIEKISCQKCGKRVNNLESHTEIYHPKL